MRENDVTSRCVFGVETRKRRIPKPVSIGRRKEWGKMSRFEKAEEGWP